VFRKILSISEIFLDLLEFFRIRGYIKAECVKIYTLKGST